MTQVMTGVGGLVNHIRSRTFEHSNGLVARFIPVVFTTAEIWTTPQDLGAASIETGKFTEPIQPAIREDWIWVNHNVSPTLQHSVPAANRPPELEKALRIEFSRTVAIVSPTGITTFLSRDFSHSASAF